MNRTRLVAAGVAALLVTVLAACTGSPAPSGSDGADGTATSPIDDHDGAADGGTSEGGSATEPTAAPEPPGVGEVGGSACGTPHGPYADPGTATGTVRTGVEALAYSLNPSTGHGNAAANTAPAYLLSGPGLFYYDEDSQLINNDSLGTCTLDSLDPLTVTYRLDERARWSDGTPVTAADLILNWAAASGHWNTADIVYTADGDLGEIDGIAFDADSLGARMITDWPDVSADGRSVTFVYDDFYVDYPLTISIGVPAHVVAQHALGIDDAAEATAALLALLRRTLPDIEAASTADRAEVAAVADFWNTGFDLDQMPADPSLTVGLGAYRLTEWKAGQYMIFDANPDYTWGPRPGIGTIVWTYAPDVTAAVASLQRGELDLSDVRTNSETFTSTADVDGDEIATVPTVDAVYEHIDLVFDNGGPFDPARYGGDAETARLVRQAFLLTIPRTRIVEDLVHPANPAIGVRDSFLFRPDEPGYAQTTEVNGSRDYADAGSDAAIARARDLLTQAGVTTPVQVRLLYSAHDFRRGEQYTLIADAAAEAGFEVIDGADTAWASRLGDGSTHDAVMFAWQAETAAISQALANYRGADTDSGIDYGQNNFGHYSNPRVNAALDDLIHQRDPDRQRQDRIEVDTLLWQDAFGLPLYQHPGLVAFRTDVVTGVTAVPLSPTFVGAYWSWRPVD